MDGKFVGSLPKDTCEWPQEVVDAITTLERYGINVSVLPVERMSSNRKAVIKQLLDKADKGEEDSRLHSIGNVLKAIERHSTESPAYEWIVNRLREQLFKHRGRFNRKPKKGDKCSDYPLFPGKRSQGRIRTPEMKTRQIEAWATRYMLKQTTDLAEKEQLRRMFHERWTKSDSGGGTDNAIRMFNRDAQAAEVDMETERRKAVEYASAKSSFTPWGRITGELFFTLHPTEDKK
jgi:hypothetical protein